MTRFVRLDLPADTEVDPEAFKEWLARRPPHLRAVAEQYPPGCYRSKLSPAAHLLLYTYGELVSASTGERKAAINVVHGRDSSHPAMYEVNFDPANLVPCGCGKWKTPTPEQSDELKRRVHQLGGRVPDPVGN